LNENFRLSRALQIVDCGLARFFSDQTETATGAVSGFSDGKPSPQPKFIFTDAK